MNFKDPFPKSFSAFFETRNDAVIKTGIVRLSPKQWPKGGPQAA